MAFCLDFYSVKIETLTSVSTEHTTSWPYPEFSSIRLANNTASYSYSSHNHYINIDVLKSPSLSVCLRYAYISYHLYILPINKSNPLCTFLFNLPRDRIYLSGRLAISELICVLAPPAVVMMMVLSLQRHVFEGKPFGMYVS